MELAQGGVDFVLPTNPAWVEMLKQKKVKAEATLAAFPFRAPELMLYQHTIIRLVDDLLAGKTVNSWALSREFAEMFGGVTEDFARACGVVDDICKTGGKNLVHA